MILDILKKHCIPVQKCRGQGTKVINIGNYKVINMTIVYKGVSTCLEKKNILAKFPPVPLTILSCAVRMCWVLPWIQILRSFSMHSLLTEMKNRNCVVGNKICLSMEVPLNGRKNTPATCNLICRGSIEEYSEWDLALKSYPYQQPATSAKMLFLLMIC